MIYFDRCETAEVRMVFTANTIQQLRLRPFRTDSSQDPRQPPIPPTPYTLGRLVAASFERAWPAFRHLESRHRSKRPDLRPGSAAN